MASTTVQLSGGTFQDLAGNPLALGTLVLSLSQDGQVNGSTQIAAGSEITIQLDSSGNVVASPAQYVWPNDVITPANTFYNVSAYTAEGQLVWGPNAQQILSSPSPFNIGAWVPAEVNTGIVDSSSLTLTTTGSSGAATLLGGVLNIPQYSGGSGDVSSVFTRTGAVVAQTGDYSVSQITGAAPLASPTFTGTATAPTFNATSGYEVGGTALASTNLSDTTNIGYLNGTNTFTANNTFNADATFKGTACGFDVTGIQVYGITQLLIQGGASIRFDSDGTATSSNNVNSTTCNFYASYWDGVNSVATTGEFVAIASPASGSNPVTTLGFTFYPNGSPPSGSGTGTGAYSFDSPVYAPTATSGTNTTQVATTAFVTAAVAGGVGAVSSVFTRTGDVVAVSGDYTVSQVTGAAPLASPTFTGTPAAPTASSGTNTTQLATTAFVTTAVAGSLPLTGGTMTGNLVITNPATATTTSFETGNADSGISFISDDNYILLSTYNQYETNVFMGAAGSIKPTLLAKGAATFVAGIGFSTTSGFPNSTTTGFFQPNSSGGLTLSNTYLGTDATALSIIGTLNVSSTITCSELQTTQTPTASTTASDHSVPIVLNGTTYYMRLSTTA